MKNLVKFLGVAVAISVVFYAVGGLFAHHFALSVLDPEKQYSFVRGYENRIPREWMIGSSVKWTLIAPTNRKAEYTALVTSAIEEWTDAIPDLAWTHTDGSDWNVKFEMSGAGCPLGKRAVHVMNSDLFVDATRSANYYKKGLICYQVERGPRYTDDSRKNVLMHEIGHVYGLHEQYVDKPEHDGPCGDGPSSIMDASIIPSGVFRNCDGLTGPSTTDVANVRGL